VGHHRRYTYKRFGFNNHNNAIIIGIKRYSGFDG
jgi:hypothetical protein